MAVEKFMSPVFRASFPNVFEARPGMDGGPAKFGVSALWTPASFSERDKKLWAVILKAMDDVSLQRFKKKIGDLPANFKTGLRDGEEKGEMEGYGPGVKFANLTTKMRPGVIDVGGSKIGPEEGNAEEIYAGCYCRATVTIYTYDNKGKGVALGLMNLQKIKDGPRLDNRTDASADFADAELDTAWLEEGGEEDPLA